MSSLSTSCLLPQELTQSFLRNVELGQCRSSPFLLVRVGSSCEGAKVSEGSWKALRGVRRLGQPP